MVRAARAEGPSPTGGDLNGDSVPSPDSASDDPHLDYLCPSDRQTEDSSRNGQTDQFRTRPSAKCNNQLGTAAGASQAENGGRKTGGPLAE